jgi:hypothetical protein
VQHVTGEMVRIDFVEFEPTTPVEEDSWARIKSIYR